MSTGTDNLQDIPLDADGESDITVAAALGRRTLHGRTFHESAEPGHVYFLQTPDGVSRHVADPKPHGETLLSPTALAEFARDFKGERSAIFLGKERIVFVFDTDNRRDSAACSLAYSEQFKALQRAMQGVPQKEFARLLRIGLRGAVLSATLLPAVESVKFIDNESGGIDIGHGREGMSVTVQRELTGVNQIDEEVTVRLTIYEDVAHEVQVNCAVEIDPAKKTFALTPLPAQLRTAFDVTFEQIENDLEKAGVPIYRGTP